MTEAKVGFWDFALETYPRAGVEAACLSLQDEHGLDVPVLLFCLWLGQSGVSIQPLLRETMVISEHWQPIAAGFRQARRGLKPLVNTSPLSSRAEIARLRHEAKDAELAAERLQMEELARLAVGHQTVAENARNLATVNLKSYFTARNVHERLLGAPEVLRILDALFPT
jgi:uncharacterized protein (TIGR02444 family)